MPNPNLPYHPITNPTGFKPKFKLTSVKKTPVKWDRVAEISESTAILKQADKVIKPHTLKEISKNNFDATTVYDTRSIQNNSRAKERGEALWNGVKKITAVGEYVPVPIVRYPSMALNSAMGAVDAYDDLKKGDTNSAVLDGLGSLPLPGSSTIKSFGVGAGKKNYGKNSACRSFSRRSRISWNSKRFN